MMNSGSNEDGGVGPELLELAREGGREDETLRMLEAEPTLIHVTDPVGDTTAHLVARAGNLEIAKQVIGLVKKHELSEVLLEQNIQGDTPLHLAIANGHEYVAVLLFEAESDAGLVKNEAGVFPYEMAREAGFVWRSFMEGATICSAGVDIELALVNEGVDESCDSSDDEEEYDVRLLHKFYRTIFTGKEDLVAEALREHPRLASRRIPWSGTYLHVAARVGQVGLLRLLVGQMTKDKAVRLILDQQNDDGETALHAALQSDRKDVALYLTQLAPTAAFRRSRNKKAAVSPLYLAVEKGHNDLVKCMLQAMPLATISPSTRESLLAPKKPSLLNTAISARNLGTLIALMEDLPELIKVVDYKGWRVLSYAAYKGYLDGVRYLLKNFPESVKDYDQDGSLPLHKAVGGGHVSIVTEFLQHFPHTLYDVSKNGQSILHFAVKCAKADVLSYLTEELTGVNKIFHLKDDKGKTFIDLADELKR